MLRSPLKPVCMAEFVSQKLAEAERTLARLEGSDRLCERVRATERVAVLREVLRWESGMDLAGQMRPARADTGPGAAPNATRLTDETIEAGLDLSGVCPALVEWYGNPAHRVTIRVETHIGKYAEASLYPHFTAEDVADKLRGLAVEGD